MNNVSENIVTQLELFPLEEASHLKPSDPSLGLRQYLPQALRSADEGLVREFVIILYFIVTGMANGAELVQKWEKKLGAVASESERNRAEKELQKAKRTFSKRQEIKYSGKGHILAQLNSLGVIRSRVTAGGKPHSISLGVSFEEAREIVRKFRGVYPPRFHQRITNTPYALVSEVSETLRRSDEILRPYDAKDTPEWAFFVPSCFNDALDIQLVSRKCNTVEYAAWTQGANFAFDAGDVLFKDWASYQNGHPALQIEEAEKARGGQVEKLDLGADVTSSNVQDVDILSNATKGYYPGRVVFKDIQSGETKTTTQLDFVKMLIGSAA